MQLFDTPYTSLVGNQSIGFQGSFGINIEVGGSIIPDDLRGDDTLDIRIAASKAAKLVEDAIREYHNKTSEAGKLATEKNRELIDKIFSEKFPAFFVEEIPNGYCSDSCCKHLPWFVVTTSIGRIKIGWRKRVIEIDWKDSLNKEYSADLFPDEEVTKYDHYIHAWSIEDAKRYVEKVLTTAS